MSRRRHTPEQIITALREAEVGLANGKTVAMVSRSLSAGVVPRRGQHLIQVGRRDEIGAMVRDLERLEDGGSAVRFLIGQYGSGKTFFLHLTRSLALSRGFVTVHADLTPTRRIHSTGGHGRALFAELAHNMATRTSPEGGALMVSR